MDAENGFEEDWKLLRRKFSDSEIQTTMNMAEGIERLLKAVWEYLGSEGMDATASIRFDHRIEKNPTRCLYRAVILFPHGLETKITKDALKRIQEFNTSDVFVTTTERALEILFNNFARFLATDRDIFAAQVANEEKELNRRKGVLKELDHTIMTMGQFNLEQANLPFPGPDPQPAKQEVVDEYPF